MLSVLSKLLGDLESPFGDSEIQFPLVLWSSPVGPCIWSAFSASGLQKSRERGEGVAFLEF